MCSTVNDRLLTREKSNRGHCSRMSTTSLCFLYKASCSTVSPSSSWYKQSRWSYVRVPTVILIQTVSLILRSCPHRHPDTNSLVDLTFVSPSSSWYKQSRWSYVHVTIFILIHSRWSYVHISVELTEQSVRVCVCQHECEYGSMIHHVPKHVTTSLTLCITIFGTLITKTIIHQQVLLYSHITCLV